MAIIYQSQKMRQLLEHVRRYARTSATVLLCGESGTGKELLAQSLHQQSPRRTESYIRLNCSALAENLVESELFGHEAGAFTGALQRRIGRFEETDSGTLFLDEIGELPAVAQAKLLRVLEEREYQRVGSNRLLRFSGRVVAATNRDLSQDAELGRFRADLYHRLNVLVLSVPPLRERREDIPALVNHFIRQCQPELDQPVRGVTRNVMQQLCEYDWPGNVRELRNTILRGCILSPTDVIESLDLPQVPFAEESSAGEPDLPSPFDRLTLEEIERRVILLRLQRHQGNQQEVAAALGITPRTLRNKITRYRRLGLTG